MTPRYDRLADIYTLEGQRFSGGLIRTLSGQINEGRPFVVRVKHETDETGSESETRTMVTMPSVTPSRNRFQRAWQAFWWKTPHEEVAVDWHGWTAKDRADYWL
jgi:hypothetical protein